jgi:hypothetical protein
VPPNTRARLRSAAEYQGAAAECRGIRLRGPRSATEYHCAAAGCHRVRASAALGGCLLSLGATAPARILTRRDCAGPDSHSVRLRRPRLSLGATAPARILTRCDCVGSTLTRCDCVALRSRRPGFAAHRPRPGHGPTGNATGRTNGPRTTPGRPGAAPNSGCTLSIGAAPERPGIAGPAPARPVAWLLALLPQRVPVSVGLPGIVAPTGGRVNPPAAGTTTALPSIAHAATPMWPNWFVLGNSERNPGRPEGPRGSAGGRYGASAISRRASRTWRARRRGVEPEPGPRRRPFVEDEPSSGRNGWNSPPFVDDEPPSGRNGWNSQPFVEDGRSSGRNGRT